jgi:hypothetical protein
MAILMSSCSVVRMVVASPVAAGTPTTTPPKRWCESPPPPTRATSSPGGEHLPYGQVGALIDHFDWPISEQTVALFQSSRYGRLVGKLQVGKAFRAASVLIHWNGDCIDFSAIAKELLHFFD